MRDKTERELVALARGGDKQAFGELIERYQQMALGIAQHMVGQEELARELTQEAFLAAYLSLAQLREDGRFRNWLYSIILNTCRSYIRGQKQSAYSLETLVGETQGDLPTYPDTWLDPEEVAEERELQEQVLGAVQELAPGERVATLLFYYEQRSVREIAALLHISETAVKSRLFQARKKLATMNDEGNTSTSS